MTRGNEKNLGRIVELVRTDPRFAADRVAFRLLQGIVTGLKRMRIRAGLNQTEMAERLGVTQGRVSQVESGLADHAPSLDMIARYAAVCSEQVGISFGGDVADVETMSRAGWRRESVLTRPGKPPLTLWVTYPHAEDRAEAEALQAAVDAHPDEVTLTEKGDALRISGELAREIEHVLIQGAAPAKAAGNE